MKRKCRCDRNVGGLCRSLAETRELPKPSAARRRSRIKLRAPANAEIIHDAVAGRVRFRHLGLRARKDAAPAIKSALRDRPGITSARVSGLTGSVLVEFRPPMTIPRLVRIVDAAASGRPLRPTRGSPPIRPLSADAAVACQPDARDPWHAIPIDQAAGRLGAQRFDGLSPDEAAHRLAIHGRNELRRAEPRSAASFSPSR